MKYIRCALLLLFVLSSSARLDAKRVKLGKNIVYEGEVQDKNPCGEGSIIVYGKGKWGSQAVFLELEGTFKGESIENVRLSYKAGGLFCFKGMRYSIDDKARRLTIQASDFLGDEGASEADGVLHSDGSYLLTYAYEKNRWVLHDYPQQMMTRKRKTLNDQSASYVEEKDFPVEKREEGAGNVAVGEIMSGDRNRLQDAKSRLLFDNGVEVHTRYYNYSSVGKYGKATKGDIDDMRVQGGWSFEVTTKDSIVWKGFANGLYSAYDMEERGLPFDLYHSVITFGDGGTFEGTARLKDCKDTGIYGMALLSRQLSRDDIQFVEGKQTKANGKVVEWRYGESDEKCLDDNPFQAYPIEYETGDLGHVRYVRLNHRAYDGFTKTSTPEQLKCLVGNNPAGYFQIDNVKTDLQKRTFLKSPECQQTYILQMQAERKSLLDDEYMVKIPIKSEFTDLESFAFNAQTGRFELEIRDTESKSVNAGCRDFHFLLLEHLCLTYPRSLVSVTTGKNYFGESLYVQNGQTCKVTDEDALKVEDHMEDCEMVWVFKFEKAMDDKIYGRTTRLYVANKKTGEIYCDLSGSLGASQASFKSTKVIRDNSPKTVYHARGRQENCGVCLGTGQGWQGGICPFCGGKGWYIEHNW